MSHASAHLTLMSTSAVRNRAHGRVNAPSESVFRELAEEPEATDVSTDIAACHLVTDPPDGDPQHSCILTVERSALLQPLHGPERPQPNPRYPPSYPALSGASSRW